MFKRFGLICLTIIFLCSCGSSEAAQKGASVEFLLSQVRASGVALSGGKAYFYVAGATTTLKTIWTDRDKTTPAANPYTLDANATAQLYGDGVYRVVIKDSAGVTKYDRDYLAFTDILTAGLERYSGDFTSLNDAITQIGSTPTTLNVSTAAFPVTANVAVPATLTLNFTYPGYLSAGAYTVTGLKEAQPEWFGVNTTPGTTDMSTAIVKAIASAPVIDLSATTYNTSPFNVPAGKTIRTAGLATIIQRRAGSTDGVRTLTVTGSNVVIGSHTTKGNIATETGEQNHGVFVQATDATGDISNVHIGDVTGTDIRGDVVYAGQGTGTASKLRNVSIGNVMVNNVYRNGVSLVSGDGITVASVTGSQIGLVHLDIESNVGSGPTTNVTVGYIKGRSVGLIGQAPADYVDNVTINVLDLSTDHASQSTPSYAPGVTFSQDALVVRNLISANIGTFRVDGYDRYAIGGVDTSGLINIGTVYARNCAVASTTYDAYFKGVYKLNIDYLDIAITGANKRGFDGFSFINISNIKADIQDSAVLLRNCTDVTIGNIVQSGVGGFMLTACSRIIVNGGSFSGTRLTTTSHQCTFKNFAASTVAAGFMFSSTYEDHILINTTLTTNSDTTPVVNYYAMGTGIVDYINTLRFGTYHLWIGTGGKLYIKDSAPANITDGTIVGTQS